MRAYRIVISKLFRSVLLVFPTVLLFIISPIFVGFFTVLLYDWMKFSFAFDYCCMPRASHQKPHFPAATCEPPVNFVFLFRFHFKMAWVCHRVAHKTMLYIDSKCVWVHLCVTKAHSEVSKLSSRTTQRSVVVCKNSKSFRNNKNNSKTTITPTTKLKRK